MSDGKEELAEVQNWAETVRLRKDLNLKERKKFDEEHGKWKQ